jgi:outer membrane protein TolC
MPVHPTDHSSTSVLADPATGDATTASGTEDSIAQALRDRLELGESTIDLENRRISRLAARNALLPEVTFTGFYAGTGLAGTPGLNSGKVLVPPGLGGAIENSLNNSAPDYYVGLNVNIPLRNRIAKSDQYRSELEARQSELRLQQLKKQIRIEVRNAEFALKQSQARVLSARKARDLSQKTFDITAQEQELGAGSNLQTLGARRDLSVAESALVAALTAYEKARIELDRSVGATLEANGISVDAARNGTAGAIAQAANPGVQ